MFRNVFYMFLGAFIALAFFAPDQFDDFRSGIQEAASGGYAYVQEHISGVTEKSEGLL